MIIANNATADEIADGALAVCKFAESFSESPGVAATLLTCAVVTYAANQGDDAVEALEEQIAFLQRRLEALRDSDG